VRIAYALFFWTLSILLLLSLTSYDPMDVSYFTTSPNSPPVNNVGLIGAWGAFGLLFVLGFSAYLVSILVFYAGCAVLRGPGEKPSGAWGLRAAFGVLMVVALTCCLQIPANGWMAREAHSLDLVGPGGILGDALTVSILLPYLGNRGALVVCAAVLVASSLVFTRFNLFFFIGVLLKGGISAAGKTVKSSFDVISFKRREIPLGMRKVRVRPFEKFSRRPRKVKITLSPPKEAQSEMAIPRPERPVVVDRAPKVAATAPPAAPAKTRKPRVSGTYRLPSVDLLHEPAASKGKQMEGDLQKSVDVLQGTLKEFGIEADVGNVIRGPVITRYEVHPAPGVKVQKITALADDLALAMAAGSIRIVAPIPGKSAVGIEIPNPKATLVGLKEMLLSKEYRQGRRQIPLAIGKEISGSPVVADLREMPHLLIAGSTGSGKTVCINSIILTMLFSCSPAELKLILIDPKRVEMTHYRDIPHLLTPVVTESKMVAQALRWAMREMERRYKLFSEQLVRDIMGFNAKIAQQGRDAKGEDGEPLEHLPFIVVIIDELADLMLIARKEIEDPIIRLAQMGRAAGLHIILATQRPSVNVITGLIKANFPTRIAFRVASKVDSKVILDAMGADKLLGRGDMLFIPPGASRRLRIQGTLIDDAEINAAVDFVRSQAEPSYREDILAEAGDEDLSYEDIDDELYDEAVHVVRQLGLASASMLQRRMRIGYTRAARLVDMMEERGIVGPQQGSKPREVF